MAVEYTASEVTFVLGFAGCLTAIAFIGIMQVAVANGGVGSDDLENFLTIPDRITS